MLHVHRVCFFRVVPYSQVGWPDDLMDSIESDVPDPAT